MMGDDEKNPLELLKQDYIVLQEKHGLPCFDKLNRDFQIEKIAGLETDYLIREVAKLVSERLSDFMRFIEGILNPVNGSILVFSILRALGDKERGILAEVYKNIAKTELKMIRLGLDFDEAQEAAFIKEAVGIWKEVKPKISSILDAIDNNWEKDFRINGKDKFYFN